MTFHFRKGVREGVTVLVALAGASGSGKTFSALRMAKGLARGKPVAFIDTEARRALHYADRFDFLHCDMEPPFHPERFIEAVRAAEKAGAAVIIVDSFSHEYDGVGGILEWAEQIEAGTPKPGIENPREPKDSQDWWKDWAEKPVKSPGNWKEPKREHRRMVSAFLQVRAHLIFCLRADEKIEIVKGDGGKTQIKPLGWMPICEKRFMFEMTSSFTLAPARPGAVNYDLPNKIQEQHRALFRDGAQIGEAQGEALAAWAQSESAPAKPAPAPSKVAPSAPVPLATEPPKSIAVTERDGAMDWTAWAQAAGAAIRSAPDRAWLARWSQLNVNQLGNFKRASAKAGERMQALIDQRNAEFDDPPNGGSLSSPAGGG